MAHPEVTLEYSSGASADTTSFSVANPALWAYAQGGPGTLVVLDCTGANNVGASRTYNLNSGEIRRIEAQAFTSTTCARVVLSSANNPPIPPPPFPSLVLGNQVQSYVDAGTVQTVGFTPAVGTMYPFNFQATGNISFPKITAAIDGIPIALSNHGTGATAVTLVPNGTDSFGVVANGVTAATAASPGSQKAQRYIPMLAVGQWVPGI